MPELVLQRTADTLEVTLGEHYVPIPWTSVAPDVTTGQRIYDDAIAYGKNLFEKTFPAGPLRTALTSLRANERLVLVIDDPHPLGIPARSGGQAAGRAPYPRALCLRGAA